MKLTTRFCVVAVLAILIGGLLPSARAADTDPLAPRRSPALCGEKDTPETGIQGDVPRADQESGRAEDGYNCGLAVVGNLTFDGQASGALAWSDTCAYVQTRDDMIQVVDVSKPEQPKVVDSLDSGGASENIHAVTTDDRAVLVASRSREGRPDPVTGTGAYMPVDVFDVSTCTAPELLGTIEFPARAGDAGGPVHNLTLNPSGTKVYGTIPLQEADITDLTDPDSWSVQSLHCEIVAQYHPLYAPPSPGCDLNDAGTLQLAHMVAFNADGSRLYIGGQQPQPYEEMLHIVDMTTERPTVLATVDRAPGHGIEQATIDGVEYLFHSDETAPGIPQPAERRANGCLDPDPEPGVDGTPFASPAQTRILDISEETPLHVAELDLAINGRDPLTCAAALDSSVNSTIHYHNVDDRRDTTFVMAPMKNAGLRIFDVRDPSSPAEVAYFNPGQYRDTNGEAVLDRARMHTYYQASHGHIWLLSERGGFWVLELEPQVREALDLPPKRFRHPHGRPARPAGAGSSQPVLPVGVDGASTHRFCSLWQGQ